MKVTKKIMWKGGIAINYFIIQTQPSLLDMIQITGWEDKIDSRWLCVNELYRIPKRMVLLVKMGEFTPLPDIITAPFLMVSELVYGVIQMYGDMVYTRDLILMDFKNKMQRRYYLLVLEDQSIKGHLLGERNFFQMESGRGKFVVSLDFAESILRRGAVGISLKEINFV